MDHFVYVLNWYQRFIFLPLTSILKTNLLSFSFLRCQNRNRLDRHNDENAGPAHPDYPSFRLRRSRKRVCHYYYPNQHFQPNSRVDEVIDTLAQRSIMASGSGRLATGVHTIWEDNSPDSLVDLSARCVLANPGLLFNVKPQAAGRGGGRRTATGRRLKAASFGDEDEELEEDFDDDDEDADRELEDERNFVDFDAIHEGIVLPAEICERLVETMISEGLDIDDRVAKAFSDTTVTRLRRCCLRGSTISPPGFERLAKHKPREILIHNCDRLNSSDVLESLNGNMDNTVELTITGMLHGSRDGILPCAVTSIDTLYDDLSEDSMDEDDKEAGKFESRGYILKGPNLQRLSIHDLEIRQGVKYFELLLRPLNKLTHLDLSGARHREGFGDFEWLLPTNNTLVSLVLHNVPELDQTALNTISKLTKLRHLDISQNSQKQGEGTYDYPNIVLRRLVESLSNLRSLDISGTNLAGNGSFDIEQNASPTINSEEKHKVDPPAEEKPDARPEGFTAKCDIPGLSSRVDRPLDFLGLYRTHHGASCRVHIPAKEISGDLNEAHILTAGKRYLDRPFVLENVLNDLFGIFRYENCSNLKEALDIILLAMERHPDEKVSLVLMDFLGKNNVKISFIFWQVIQISGSASLYYAVKSEIRGAINVKVKRKILSTLLNGMFAHRHDTVMMRNGCLTLCQFQIPQDVVRYFHLNTKCVFSFSLSLLSEIRLREIGQDFAVRRFKAHHRGEQRD